MKQEDIKDLEARGKKANNPLAKKWKEKLAGLARSRALKSLVKKK